MTTPSMVRRNAPRLRSSNSAQEIPTIASCWPSMNRATSIFRPICTPTRCATGAASSRYGVIRHGSAHGTTSRHRPRLGQQPPGGSPGKRLGASAFCRRSGDASDPASPGYDPKPTPYEQDVTYPSFHKSAEGDFLMTYRLGKSKEGDLWAARFNPVEKTWARTSDGPFLGYVNYENATPPKTPPAPIPQVYRGTEALISLPRTGKGKRTKPT